MLQYRENIFSWIELNWKKRFGPEGVYQPEGVYD